ncbi:MAG: TIGR04282 family arsenosugar biosynthesis glycosyltransferase [Cytophagales bacterium]|nr:TIGR04282 family arsenosugar biosynthesis glycosyltransferase [Cytophagales bacterium]
MKKLLIIFVKNPELGKVKSRLAKSIGKEKALQVYKKLLQQTKNITVAVDCDKLICYSDRIERNDLWDNINFKKSVQAGKDLGDRMFNSIRQASKDAYNRICLIGSDNMELTSEIINRAFGYLDGDDIVLGPAKDGGYYLIGMKYPVSEIFSNKKWGSSDVLQETINDISRLGLSCRLLPELNDIDEIEDINEKDLDFLLP